MRLLPKHMRPFVFLFSVFFLLGTFLLIDGPGMFALDSVSAQGDDVLGVETFGETTALSGGGEGGIIGIVARIINIFLGLLGVIAVGLMIYAGVVWMSSAGDETKIATAKKILVNATIGLAIIMSSWAIASFILNKLGVASGVLEEEVGFGDGSDGGTFDCLGFCVSPGNERERCTEDIFVVKSLSPNTDNTGMHNTVVRAVFSDKVKTADKNRLVSLVAKTDTVGIASVFDGSLPASVNNILTTVAAQAGGWAQWASYGNGFTIQNNGEKSISRVDDDTFGIVTEFQLTAQADGGGALQKKEIRGMEIGKLYELKMVYKVETAGSFEVRFADFDQNSAYTDPQSNSPVIAGGLTNTSGVWRVHSQRFLWQPTTRGENSLANDGAIIFSVKNSPNIAFKGQVASLGVYPVFEPGTTVPPSRVELSEDNHVVSAYYDALENVCTTNTTDSCLGIGDYEIVVPEDLESVQGRSLQVRSDIPGCEDLAFPRVAGFSIADNSSVDLQDPTISPITFKKDGADVPAHLLLENNAYTVHAEFADRSAAQGGIGLVTYTISGEGMQTRTVQDGMSVADGSDGPYMVSSTLLFGALRGGDPDQYTITVSGFDIDNNPTSTEHVFNVQGASCNNGVLDEGEVLADEGGVCASNGACLINADCLSGLCVEGECKADKPMIVDVYPQAWAGAPGNIITLAGSGFGEDEGRVIFSYTNNQGNTISVDAGPACAGSPAGDLWNDTAVVVAVPAGLPENSLSSIRIERSDYNADNVEHAYKFDSSADTHGPRRGNIGPGGLGGYFLQNNQIAPGLCAIVPQDNPVTVIDNGLINQQVIALGQNFGNEVGMLNFGSISAAISSWDNAQIQSRVPNMPRQRVYVFTQSSNDIQSNALPFTINTEEIVDAPEITTVEGVPTTNGSLITIKGRHFGTSGRVFLGLDATIDDCLVGNDAANCIELKVAGIEGCNDVVTWRDQEIIAEVVNVQDAGPIIAAGNYRVGVLRTSQGLRGSNTDQAVEVTNAEPKPSLCGVLPPVGPAPSENITLFGKNLSANDTIYYFKKDALLSVEGARNVIQNGGFAGDGVFWTAGAQAALEISDEGRLVVRAADGVAEVVLSYNQPIANLVAGETYRISFDFSSDDGASIIPRLDGQDFPQTDGIGVYSETVTLPDGFEGNDLVLRIVGGSISIDNISLKKETGLETWLSSAVDEYNNQPVSKEVNEAGTEMQTQIPEDDNRYSMITGPIRVLSEGGELSNSVQYSVQNCLEDGFNVPDGMMCCLEGEDAGMLRPANALCAGEVREAGYVWRFNTGLIPVIPRVLEQCNDSIIARVEREDGDEEPPARLTPSPSPSGLLTRDQLACPNANVTVVFNTPMSNIDQNDVTIVACGQDEDPLCDENGIGLVGFNYNSGQNLLNITRGGLAQDTWYEVRLDTTKIKSPDGILLRSGGEEGCPDNTYCFRFKTQGNACELTGAFVSPSTYTTKHFGVIQDPSFPRDETHIFNPEHPYIFTVLGLTEKACLTIDVRDRDWLWGSGDDTIADPTQQPERKDQAIVKAIQPTSRVDIFSNLVEPLIKSEPLRLTISPEDPRVVDYWPNCTQTCANSTIGVVFNRRLLDLSVDNVVVEKCDNSVCESVGPNSLPVSLVGDLEREEIEFRVRPDDVLEHGAYYKVTIQDAQPVAGYQEDRPVAGQVMPDFSWVFRVRGENAEEAFCTPDSISVIPQDYTAREVGERNVYTALPISAPDACSRTGQELDPFGYDWEWESQDSTVAEITTFSSPVSENRSCNNQCLKTGSDILRQDPVFTMLCGNGRLDDGEDCDIAFGDETPGVSCGYDCLRPGNTEEACGNNIVQPELGEECDNDSVYCSDTCLNTGTEPLPAVMEEGRSYCGSGDVGPGEDCDGGEGCNSSCLNTGTLLSNIWCVDHQANQPVACQNAVTVCGNGDIEHNEECDNGASCTDQCVYGDLSGLADPNDNEYYQDPVTEGATRFATRAGSSLLYSTPSFCGDSVGGIGEDPACEAAAEELLGQNPTQLATAIGEGQMNEDNEMRTEITANAATYVDREGNAQALDISGLGTYTLQCGYAEGGVVEENSILVSTTNNCPNNSNNAKGVGSSTCCSDRPVIATHYPDQDADQVCLNTALHITFDEVIAEESITPNAFALLRGSNNECEDGEVEVAEDQINLLAVNIVEPAQEKKGFFTRTWQVITGFFRGLFFEDVLAINQNLTWCKTATTLTPTPQYFFEDETLKTRIHLQMSEALEADTSYALYVSGGVDGLKNSEGVGMRSKEQRRGQFITSDIISFVTGQDICTVKLVSVFKDSHTYDAPNTSNNFSIVTYGDDGAQLQSIDNVYDWTYRWGPRTSLIYTIPQEDAYDNNAGEVVSTAVEGSELLVGSIDITVDVSEPSTVGKTFSGVSELTSFFCENPWPSRDDMPYNNDAYNFSFYYCADAGLSGERLDDLPFLDEPTIIFDISDPPSQPGNQGLLYKVIFPSDKNEDAIGVQVFQNPNASTTRQWLDFYFPGTVDNMQPVSISGYGGFTNGHTYYVAARNMTDADTLYNNIYSFTINRDAQENTKQVFTQIIDTLELNSNLSNFNLCLADDVAYEAGDMFRLSQRENIPVTDIGCSTDFECRDSYGNNLSGTNGVCFSARDKMARDIDRLASLKNLENSVERYKSERGQYPQIVGGTFVAQYTNSRWPSWNILSQMIGGAQIDPINAWTQCSRCNGGLAYGSVGEQIAPKYGNLCVLRVACGTDDTIDSCEDIINNGGNPTFGAENSELFSTVFSCAMQANSCEDAARCYDIGPVVNTRCGLRNYESGEFLCAENEQGFLEWRFLENSACQENTQCELGFQCADGRCSRQEGLRENDLGCEANDQCKTGHCATLLGGGEGLCVNRDQCIKTNGDGLVAIGNRDPADGQFVCDNGELVIDQNNNQISDAKEIAYQGAVACQSDIQCPGALNSCEDLDQQTCWDAANATVHCPALSQMFEYESLGANAYKIHAPLEFFSGEQAREQSGNGGGVGFDLSDSFETTLWCEQPRGGAGGPICGDGIVSGDEQCDIANYERVTDTLDCQRGQVQTQYCSNECTIAQTECGVSATCGDGVVDAGEQCDDGVNNGRYGSLCSDDCIETNNAGYCGDDVLQAEHEFCDVGADGVCSYYREGVGPLAPILYFVIDRSRSMNRGVVSGGYDLIELPAIGDNEPLTEMTRWTALTRAIESVFGEIGSLGNDDLAKPKVSLIGFSGSISLQDRIKLGPGFYDENQLNTAFDEIGDPDGGTPLAQTLRYLRCGQYGTNTVAEDCDTLPAESIFRFNNEQDALRPKKMIIFVDGDDNNDQYSVDSELAKLLNLPEPIETYVVGVGNEVDAFDEWAEAGGTGAYISADGASDITNAINQIRSCGRDYSVRNGNSCSADCQDFGGYCGDGIIQRSQGEQCDDGNYVSDDGCNIYCKTGAVAEQPQDINGTCGDGVVQNPNNNGEEEVCDLGVQNGIACDPEYGESCTYCSHDCRENLTVDPIAQCGDGKIDFVREGTAGELVERLSGSGVNFSNLRVAQGINEGSPVDIYEACDSPAVSGGVHVSNSLIPIAPSVAGEPRISQLSSAVSVFSGLYLARDDNPVFEELDNPSLSCETLFEDEDSPALNRKWKVLRDNQVAVGEISCSNTCDAVSIGCHICGDVTEPLPPYTDNERAEPKVKVHNVLGYNFSWHDDLNPRFVFNKGGVGLFADRTLFSHTGPVSRVYGFESSSGDVLQVGSANQCGNKYGVRLSLSTDGNFDGFYDADCQGVTFDDCFQEVDFATQQRLALLFGKSIFDFPVNNERDEVENEIFVSPAVPPDTFRVVVRYNGDAASEGSFGRIQYGGLLFNAGFSDLEDGLFSYKKGILDNPEIYTNCVGLDLTESGYYTQTSSSRYISGTLPLRYHPCRKHDESFTSSRVPGARLEPGPFAQSTFIKTETVENNSFAFFVEGFDDGLVATPIVDGLSHKVTVELYRHHEGQNPELSLYKPDYVFRMNLAEGSNNLGARYWHVFNLVKNGDEYEVQEANRDGQVITTDNTTQYTSHNGSIETDYVDVLCNVSGQACR